MTVSLVLLTYNEVDGLANFLPLIKKIVSQNGIGRVFAVDGGSTDGSLELYQKYDVRVYVQEKKGRGEAFKLAFQKSDEDALIFFSPDGNEDFDDIFRFLDYLEQKADMVIASRMMKGAVNEEDKEFFKWRKWANKSFTFIANALWNQSGRYITDSINGFRAIRRSAWEQLKLTASDYTIEYQSSIRAFKCKLDVQEFPTIEGQRIGGESYAKSIPTGIRFLKLLVREIFIGRKFQLLVSKE